MSENIENIENIPEELEPKKNGGKIKSILSWSLTVLLIVCSILVIFLNIHQRVLVDGDSMNQTLLDGDVVYVSTGNKAERGDIVVLNVSDYIGFSGDYIIKRLIATEGDKLYCEDNVVYLCVAGESEYSPLKEEYLSADTKTEDFSTVTVGAGEIFVMGDNRSVSLDSRRSGCFKREDVHGTVPDWSYALRGVSTALYNFFNQK
ncbi:MAG: signal peptidase I [Clostridia bacterium]|nr:signal peptidase I [Clostridia bacterium]